MVTGLVVKTHPNLRRTDTLKANGPQRRPQRRPGPEPRPAPDFRAHLGGRIAWLEHVHPAHGPKLRAEFERIDWG